ncbi:hypothetical protein BDZ90DRAFT_280833 [Jaminaea rosea]|uniref:Uncharacterized protein n=1 Tax=Jaminaea rosea TaxID=1569628 RepID=A0A316UR14_9BASI|nr:hypothetical protein BDZ90DRAFT_280833 [Jaminaea rosea]PWN26313.1 hypothetical protein BDZ90DRAFT_280833 [Jaminaea rosea]
MALSRPREHQIGGGHHYAQSASSSSHHGHHHHHHHHRSKPRRTIQAQGGGPLRQLQDQYEEAMALGGGSSRDASEEDNDNFSEHSDSASSMHHQRQQQNRSLPSASHTSSLHTVLSASPSSASSCSSSSAVGKPQDVSGQVMNTLPTTARDRVLMDSRGHAYQTQGSHQQAGQMRKASSGSSAAANTESLSSPSVGGPSSSSASFAAPHAVLPPSSTTSTRRGNPSAPGSSGVPHTLAQASAALSSSSSTDLSMYGGDDEAAGEDDNEEVGFRSTLDARAPSLTLGQLSTTINSRPHPSLRLDSLPPPPRHPNPSSAMTTPIAVAGARGAIGPTWMSRQDSDYLGDADDEDGDGGAVGFMSEDDSLAPRSPHSVQTGSVSAKSTDDDAATTDDDVSDEGTASPYDGDVEFSARTPVSQQISAAHMGGNGGFLAQAASVAAAHATAATPPATQAGSSRPSTARRQVEDAPVRTFQMEVGATHQTIAEGTATPRGAEDGASFNPAQAVARASDAPMAKAGNEGTSAEALRTRIVTLNKSSAVISRLQQSSPTATIRVYVGAPANGLFSRIDLLTLDTAMLRVAKLGVAATAGNGIEVQVVAGISSDDDASEGGGLALPAAQRAALARGCRWVDEVMEGVPRAAGEGGADEAPMRQRLIDQIAAGAGGQSIVLLAHFVDADPVTSDAEPEWQIRLPMPKSG